MAKVTDYVQGVVNGAVNAVGVWARRAATTNDDVQGVLIVDMDGSDNVTFSPLAKDVTLTSGSAKVQVTSVPAGAAQDGTDSTDANATQATNGVGLRGWLSTLVSLFRAGTAKVVSANLTAAADVVTVVAQNGALTDTRSTPFGAATVDTPTFGVGQNNKRLIYVVVGVAINWTTSGQATIQPYVATSAQTGVTTLGPLIDTVQSLGTTGTTLPAGTYVFDSAKFPSLAQPHLYQGFRFTFPSVPTNAAGASLITVLNGTNT